MEADPLPQTVSALLSQNEAAELDRLRADAAFAGLVLFNGEGDIVEISGLPEAVAPVFANIFDMAERIGDELGESGPQPMVFLQNPKYELIGFVLTSVTAVVLRRKAAAANRRGTTHVG